MMATRLVPGFDSANFAIDVPMSRLVWLAWKVVATTGVERFWLTAVEITHGTLASSITGFMASAGPLQILPLMRKTLSSKIMRLARATPFASLQASSPSTISNLRPLMPPWSL